MGTEDSSIAKASNINIEIIGEYPPPRGGISVHIERLCSRLIEKGAQVKVCDMSGVSSEQKPDFVSVSKSRKKWLARFLLSGKGGIVHFHELGWRFRAAVLAVSKLKGRKFVITAHSLRESYKEQGLLDRLFMRYVATNADYLIAVGDKELQGILELGCPSDRVSVIPAFIPQADSNGDLPEWLENYIASKDVIVSANGSSTELYNGVDLYGCDMLIELCRRLRSVLDIGFVYCLSRDYITDAANYKALAARAAELGDSFRFVHEDVDFPQVLRRSQLFIRPTATDGDAISLREAISLHVPSVASDVSARPQGSIIFRSRELDDLEEKALFAIANGDECRARLRELPEQDNFEKVWEVYERLHRNLR